ncbi:PREDICTED: uncharacterized protein LOC108764056 [Trachymyrmex cornetzi]|uniref:uncharacterized protein LOC108764056 n=1 Tax=Trachymyrmex cornetzi TaxID=471704 RepID=UPI00084EE100|nr:PREDICTED: uncharacterized protein LOC108764056 [Trachymyrmex cornetzi]
MGKFATVFLIELLFIVGIVLGDRFHGYESYKKFYNYRVNGGRLKHPTTASYQVTKESYYDPNDMKEKVKSRFEEGWQVRNGGNHTEVTRCDYTKQTFCEDVPDYPQEFVNQMLAKNSNLIHYAYEDVIALSPRLDNEEEPLCLSTERLIRPKTAINMKNQWMYIVQAGENFFQSIRIETCIEQDRKCRMIDDFAEGYVTMCKQKYIYRELSAISQGGDIVRDYFRLPASCCCHVHFQAIEEKARIRSFL